MTCMLTLLVWLAVLPAGVISTTKDCTVRFQDNDACVCSMENLDGPVKCSNDSQTIFIEPCYCVFYDRLINKTIVGHCYYSCYQHNTRAIEVTNSSSFNEQFCDAKERTDFFCFACKKPYALAPFGYPALDCVPCKYYGYKNWFKAFSIALLPLTMFYALSVMLGLNIASSSAAGIVVVLQCITSSPVRTYETIFTDNPNNWKLNILVKILFTATETMNLNFFRLLYSPGCLHPKLNIFEIACLEYFVALYPFLLIFVTYVLIAAYDRQYRLLIWMWKPFKACITRYRATWNIKTSLLEIFASFILLSSVKIIRVSLDKVLFYIQTYDPFGNKVKAVASLSVNVTYFSSHHLPYALLAIAVCSIFVLFPLLLLVLYPCRCFQRCLNACGLRLPILHIFMDAFQGSYKLHPRDMRYFSAFYLFLRVVLQFHAEIFVSLSTLYMSGIISLVAAGIVAIFQPYKINAHNTIDSILLLLMGIYFLSANETRLVATLKYGGNNWMISSIVQAMSITAIIFYCISLLAWKLMHAKVQAVIQKIKAKRNSSHQMIESFVRNREDSNKSDACSSTALLGKRTLTSTY